MDTNEVIQHLLNNMLMAANLHRVPSPAWLVESGLHRPLPIIELLHDSVYYPASGTDSDPITHIGRYFWSFIYADYGYTPEAVTQTLSAERFSDHKLLGRRTVTEEELPLNQWNSETDGRLAYGLPIEDNAPPFFRRGQCPFAE